MELIDDHELPPELEARIFELAAIATDLRVEAGELTGPAELLGIVDAVALLQSTGEPPTAGASATSCDACPHSRPLTPNRPFRRTTFPVGRCRRLA